MEEKGHQHQDQNRSSPSHHHGSTENKSEPVRSRWTPKPEQILILESIFNSGMVNPPKGETVRIRKLLEKFGTVGDANVFYWFQNRRSRSRRRQRQMQQASQQQQQQQQQLLQLGGGGGGGGGAILCDQAHATLPAPAASATVGFGGGSSSSSFGDSSSLGYNLPGGGSSSSSSCQEGVVVDGGFFSVPPPPPQMGFSEIDHTSPGASILYPHVAPNLNFQPGVGGNNISGLITVFINGIATEVPRGPIDIKTLFGEDVILVHSSGVPIPTNEFGFLMQSLHHGESYFLVPKPTQG